MFHTLSSTFQKYKKGGDSITATTSSTLKSLELTKLYLYKSKHHLFSS